MLGQSIETQAVSKLLKRNFLLPLVANLVLCATFVALVLNLLTVNGKIADANRQIAQANQLLKAVIDSETGLRGYLLGENEAFLQPFLESQAAVPILIAELEKGVLNNQHSLDKIRQLQSSYSEWSKYAKDAIRSKRAGTYVVGGDGILDLRKAMMDRIRAEFQSFVDNEELSRDSWRQLAEDRLRFLLSITVLLSLIVGTLLAFVGRRQLVSLSQGYSDAFEIQRKQNEALKRQAWLRSGQAELNSALRGELSVEETAERMLSFLCSYTQAVIGVIYVRNKESAVLERAATHAFEGESPARVPLGQGLVGQVAKNDNLLTLNEIPQNYLKVASGLGNGDPTHLVLAPMSTDGVVHAVVELGFVHPPRPEGIELLQLVSTSLGTTVRSANYRARLQELVMTTQQQSEELQAQQEELRVSNEELSERGRSLQEAQSRLESQHAELLQTNEQLEEQAQALENQKISLDDQNRSLNDAREALEEKANELIAANQYKSEFLANMSHELRTPLNSTLILAKLLKDNPQGNLTSEQIEFASTIYSAGNDLLNLINDILDLSKVEAGKLDIEASRFTIPSVIEGLEKTFRVVANEKKLELRFRTSAELPALIQTDRLRLEQILKNLLSNAIKFTDRGSVTLSVERMGRNSIAFSVVDTGIGISKLQKDVIFEAFRQADGTTNRKHGGTGLGLSISRNLAALLGGTLTVESVPGSGSTFTLVLPETLPDALMQRDPMSKVNLAFTKLALERDVIAVEEVSPPIAVPESIPDDRADLPAPGGRTILVVEDEVAFARILFDLSHELGFRCLVAPTIAEGYELAIQHLPSAIILDMKLPDALGLSLLDRLKENPRTRHIPVHVISGADYSREALHLGAVGYIFKPADRDELKATLHKLEKKISQEIKKVLVVEDDPVQRKAIERLISEKGVEIVAAGTGAEALAALQKTNYDCMVVDLSLPDMTGFELLEQMAATDRQGLPPVIVYTGRALSRQEEERLHRYSKTIIIKGARSPERLLDEVTLFLHQVESKLAPEKRRLLSETRNRERAFEGRQILLVDDDVRNIFALTSALEQKGAKVHIARNGREALERLEALRDVDLVLMDVMMPEMDGYTAMTEIRKIPRHEKLPIIAVTAKAMRDDYEKCLDSGATDYLAKPVDLDKLVSLMRVWLPKQVGRV